MRGNVTIQFVDEDDRKLIVISSYKEGDNELLSTAMDAIRNLLEGVVDMAIEESGDGADVMVIEQSDPKEAMFLAEMAFMK